MNQFVNCISVISETLTEKLKYTSAHRNVRLDVAAWVLDRPNSIPYLVEHCFNINDDLSYKATWILEFVCLENLELIYPFLDVFFENLPKVYKHQAVRPLAKICEMLAKRYYKKEDPKLTKLLKSDHKEIMTTCCFDWLISNQRVACEVYAMSTLYYIGTEIEWIHSELKTIIESNIMESTAGYKSRGKHVLGLIEKFRYIS